MSHGLGFWELVRDRAKKRGLYDSPAYWDKKATVYEGLARSNWPSNAYNERVHEEQMRAVNEALGDVRGLRIADVGCGTGRASVHLAQRGAKVTGLDFSPKSLEAAREEARAAGVDIGLEEHDVLAPGRDEHRGQFDIVLTIGCLTLACKNKGDLRLALDHLVELVRPSGRVLFLEPVHTSVPLSRILRMSVDDWVRECESRGLELVSRRGILFVPSRFALAFRNVPRPVNDRVFDWGERVLAATRRFELFGDYKVLLFRAAG